MTTIAPPARHGRVVMAMATLVLAFVGLGGVVSAHTDFESSVPGDGAVVDAPLDEIVVNVTNPAEPAGGGFELLDPDGAVRIPSSIDETDGTSFVLTFDPPLDAGTYGLRWSVRAGDAHPIEGSFRFDVVAAGPSGDDVTSPLADGSSTPAVSSATDAVVADGGALDEFLEIAPTGGDVVATGRAGRTMSMLGSIFGAGVLAALVWTIRGSRDELVTQLAWVRLAGLVVVAGGLVEYAALAEADGGSLGSLLSTKPGVATALKMVGGLAVMLGIHEGAGRIIAPTRPVSAAVATDLAASPVPLPNSHASADHRWTPTPTAAVGIVGVVLVLISFWFDGHTVSRGSWPIHSIVNAVHLGAASVWVGGVFAMTSIAWTRHRRSEHLGLAAMVVRFSSIATVALMAVVAAGGAMTWMVLDTPGDLFATEWGRVLVAKTMLVAVAAALGGFNHFRLRPALEERPDDPDLLRELRISLTVESVVFVAVVAVTAFLVASAI